MIFSSLSLHHFPKAENQKIHSFFCKAENQRIHSFFSKAENQKIHSFFSKAENQRIHSFFSWERSINLIPSPLRSEPKLNPLSLRERVRVRGYK